MKKELAVLLLPSGNIESRTTNTINKLTTTTITKLTINKLRISGGRLSVTPASKGKASRKAGNRRLITKYSNRTPPTNTQTTGTGDEEPHTAVVASAQRTTSRISRAETTMRRTGGEDDTIMKDASHNEATRTLLPEVDEDLNKAQTVTPSIPDEVLGHGDATPSTKTPVEAGKSWTADSTLGGTNKPRTTQQQEPDAPGDEVQRIMATITASRQLQLLLDEQDGQNKKNIQATSPVERDNTEMNIGKDAQTPISNGTYSTSTVTTTTAGKGTSYAFLQYPHTEHDNIKHTSTIGDTMAQAVENLQIRHTITKPQPTSTTAAPWTLVTNNTKKPLASTTCTTPSHEFGLAFDRTTKGNNWSTADLLLILQTIQAHDPKAMLSSADNKTRPTLVTAILHKAQKDIPWFTKFTAMKTMTWGKPSDGTTKIVFSFWLTSTIIKKDLAQLRMDSDFTEMLKGTNTYMKVTKLHEPHSKIVGYFLGKDIIHTNRDDITNRLAAHITKYSQTHWTPALDVLNTTVLGKGHNTRMVTLVVGNSDYQGVLDILTQQPMESLSFLDHRTKRQDIHQFDKMLKYHDYIVSHSTAVRLEKVTSLDTQALWEHLQPILDTTYCDISDGRIQGTTYIQCFKEKEPDVTTAIQSYLLMKFSDSEDPPIIGARGARWYCKLQQHRYQDLQRQSQWEKHRKGNHSYTQPKKPEGLCSISQKLSYH